MLWNLCIKRAIWNVTWSESFIIANNLNSGVECSSNEEKNFTRSLMWNLLSRQWIFLWYKRKVLGCKFQLWNKKALLPTASLFVYKATGGIISILVYNSNYFQLAQYSMLAFMNFFVWFRQMLFLSMRYRFLPVAYW